jgi:FtsP/CotA-like multicopper oxidase with cupredoxin domain
MLVPGERAEIVVEMSPGERAVLRSHPHDLGGGGLVDRFSAGRDTLDIMELRAAAALRPSPAVPATLVDGPRLSRATAAGSRGFRLSGTSINGASMRLGRIDATVVKDTVEIWNVRNGDGQPHSFHIHDVQFQVLSVNGGSPPPELRGWKDTVYVRPETVLELAIPFTDYADPDVPYMFHCHVLMHEDAGMMGQFVVVEPDQPAGPARGDGHRHD